MKKFFLLLILFVFICNITPAQNRGTNPYERLSDAYITFRDLDPTLFKLLQAYTAITNQYVDKTDNAMIVENAIKDMLEKLDPHSGYTNAEETRRMNEPLEANFEGIGIQFDMETDTLHIVQVLSGGPSEKVGLLAGDRIVMVNDSLIAGIKMTNTDIQKLLRGKKGTEVQIKVKRGSFPQLLSFTLIRDKIPVYSIDATYMLDPETGYIRLYRFAASSVEEFQKSLSDLKNQGMKNLILDLQGNGGGYLNIAEQLADQFLNKEKLIVYMQGDKINRYDAVSNEKGVFMDGKLVILVNEYSASASEIVAGAIQDWDRGVIVGRRTFGKGLVQRGVPLSDSSMIRLTIAKYYTPSGRSIQKPYEMGNARAYNRDLDERYYKGEMMNADSIHFSDSLKYSTLISKRTVYGGGGIMPDIFVPIDSTLYTYYLGNLRSHRLFDRLAMNIVDKNRNSLNSQYADFIQFKEKFEMTEAIFKELLDMAENEKIEFNEEQFNKSKEMITVELKAYIAFYLFERSKYFEIINDKNDSLQKALQIINDDEQYKKILSGI